MIPPPDFEIKSSGQISSRFTERNILTFQQAALFIRHLPYGRNLNKNDLTSVFADNCGTCSTKHAILKQLADENNFKELRLIIGLFKMNGINTPPVSTTLEFNDLEYIPEAHCYLKYNNDILDYTKPNSDAADFINDIIEEVEIKPNQITDFKVNFHKNYLTACLENNHQIKLTFDDIWKVREQCIQDLT